jgi:hypothetical protein
MKLAASLLIAMALAGSGCSSGSGLSVESRGDLIAAAVARRVLVDSSLPGVRFDTVDVVDQVGSSDVDGFIAFSDDDRSLTDVEREGIERVLAPAEVRFVSAERRWQSLGLSPNHQVRGQARDQGPTPSVLARRRALDRPDRSRGSESSITRSGQPAMVGPTLRSTMCISTSRHLRNGSSEIGYSPPATDRTIRLHPSAGSEANVMSRRCDQSTTSATSSRASRRAPASMEAARPSAPPSY